LLDPRIATQPSPITNYCSPLSNHLLPMTYFGFLIGFLFIPILVFLGIAIRDHRQRRPAPGFDDRKAPYIIAAHVLLALVYTTPWDNYLVATGVWNYNPQLVTGIVFGYVPLEEYTFFVVETILSGLWWWFLARRLALPSPQTFKPNRKVVYWSTLLLLVAWLFFTAQFFLGPAACISRLPTSSPCAPPPGPSPWRRRPAFSSLGACRWKKRSSSSSPTP